MNARVLLLRILGTVLVAAAAGWLVFTGQHVLDVLHHRGQNPVASRAFLDPFVTALAKALFPAGAFFGCGLWSYEVARKAKQRDQARPRR